MELILLRHAKAEDDSVTLADEMRELTPKGRKKAYAAARGLARLLPPGCQPEIWASPALRSSQTAAILAEVFAEARVSEHPAIYTGSLQLLIDEWSRLPEDAAIVVVGHEPHLSIWARQLADATLPFKKCAAAAFLLEPPALTNGTLRWFADPKTLARIGDDQNYRG